MLKSFPGVGGRGGYGQLDTLCNNKDIILRNNKILCELFDRLFLTLQLLKELIIVDEILNKPEQ